MMHGIKSHVKVLEPHDMQVKQVLANGKKGALKYEVVPSFLFN